MALAMETKQLELYYREQSHSLLPLPRGAPQRSLLAPPPARHAATCQGMPRSCSSRPQSHGSRTWPAPSGPGSPCPLSGHGSKLDAALPGLRQVRTHVLKGCRNSSAICPPFLLPARDLDVLGEPLIHRLRGKPCNRYSLMPLFGGNRDFMGAMFLILLSSSRKKNQLPNQSSEKEEISAKELLSSPGPRHTKQLSGHTKRGPCKTEPCSQEMPKLKGLSLLFQHGSASNRGNTFTGKCPGNTELLQGYPGAHHPPRPPWDGAMGTLNQGI